MSPSPFSLLHHLLSSLFLLPLCLSMATASSSPDSSPPPPCLPTCFCNQTLYDCTGRNITSFPEDTFAGYPDLLTIKLSSNKASVIHFNLFRGLSSLQSLDLGYNNISFFPRNWLAGLNALTTLNLAGNPLTVPFNVKTMIGPLPELTTLYLDSPTLLGGGGVAPDFSPLASLTPRLSVLSAKRGLTSIPPGSFSGLNLTSLNLCYSKLPNLTSHSFSGLTCGEISLEWSSISYIEPEAFSGLVADNVDLYFNQITVDSIPEGGLTLPNVSALCLAGNPFDSRIFAKPFFNEAPNLVSLDFMGGMGLGPYIDNLPTRAFASVPTLQSLQLFKKWILNDIITRIYLFLRIIHYHPIRSFLIYSILPFWGVNTDLNDILPHEKKQQ